MALPPIPNSARVELRFTCLGEQIENTLWFDHGDTLPNNADLGTLADLVGEWWTTNVRILQHTALTLREIYVQTQDGSGIEWTAVPDSTSDSGTLDTEAMPNNVVLCVSFRTGLSGRSYRGRNYVPGLTVTGVVGNFVTQVFADDMVAAYTELLVATSTGEWTWGVASHFSAGVPRIEGVITPITSVVVTDLAVDSQRRRLAGRGR